VSNPTENPATGDSGNRLDSWKEIAAYLHRTARTVQRWERDQGLPVHRLQHKTRGSVYAYKQELDAWWNGRRLELENEPPEKPAEDQSIAVLPFSDMSPERDQDYFCEGVAEEILGALSRIAGLRVASRTSSFRFKAGDEDICQVGRKLRVKNLLEGSVRKAGDRLRISVQLTGCDSGFQLWSERFDGTIEDIFAIQEEIGASVAHALEITLSPNEKAALQKPLTTEAQAYDFYLRGRKFYYGYGAQDIEFAIKLFNQATAADENFALAYAGLADCWSYIYLYLERDDTVRQQAEWASQRAVQLDAESAQAHASYAVALSLGGKTAEAEREFETALRLEPNHFEAHYYHARHCFAAGQQEKAVQQYEAAMRVRPEDYQSPLLVAQSYEDRGEAGRAAKSRELGIRLAEQHLSLNPDDVRAVYMAANGMVALGQTQRGIEWAERAVQMRPDDPMLLYNVGCIYSLAGELEKALDCLEKSAGSGLTQRGWYECDSNLDPLRTHPRFQALLATL
jgi:TolB-like protein/cytochrome c-type biogenesis protein CcmH/NrfG